MRYRVKFSDRKRGAFVEARTAKEALQEAAGERFVRATPNGRREYPEHQVQTWFFRVLVVSGATVARMGFHEIEAVVEEAPL